MSQPDGSVSLDEIACTIRQDIISMLVAAGSGHSAGPLGMADVFTALYFGGVVNYKAQQPQWSDRDRVLLSNAHICPVWYAALAQAGYFERDELKTLRKLGTRLQGHPHLGALPGIENTGGPLAQGISQAVGLATAAKLDKKPWHTWCLMGDGEQNEGQVWEAFLYAGKNKLNNLTVITDRNNIQIDGFTETVMPLEPLRAKYEAFNWHVIEVDGHNIEHIVDACREAKSILEKPTMIIAHTIPGKGVDFMEGKFEWHGKVPNDEEAKAALQQLRAWGEKIRSEHE